MTAIIAPRWRKRKPPSRIQQATLTNLDATRHLQEAVIAQAQAEIAATDAETARTHDDQVRFQKLLGTGAISIAGVSTGRRRLQTGARRRRKGTSRAGRGATAVGRHRHAKAASTGGLATGHRRTRSGATESRATRNCARRLMALSEIAARKPAPMRRPAPN